MAALAVPSTLRVWFGKAIGCVSRAGDWLEPNTWASVSSSSSSSLSGTAVKFFTILGVSLGSLTSEMVENISSVIENVSQLDLRK